ncbi:unannotated protein [freshwater metagenome]|uniref:Unannotated protein n=1 Tax=freshwater metagenome TaxID=449393 RepID=A0A6J6IG37_9ZZZZ
MHEQRNDADGDEHHCGEAVNEGAHLEFHATDLEPGDGAHNRRNTFVFSAVLARLRGMALFRGCVRISCNRFARILCGRVDFFAHGFARLRGKTVCLDNVGGKRSTSRRVIHATDPVACDDDGKQKTDRDRGDTNAGSCTGAPALTKEKNDQERRRHEGGDDPDLVDHVEHDDQPFSMSTSSMSMLCRFR